MPMIDMPATPVSGAEVVIERRVGEAGNRGFSPVVLPPVVPKERFDMVFDECQAVETQVLPGGLDFSPNGGVMNYWDSYPKHRVGSGMLRDAKVTVLQGPSLGTLLPLSRLSRDVGQVFAYDVRPGVPNGSEDRILFLIEFEGKRIKVNEILKIVFNSTPESKDCKGKQYYIKRISQVDGAPDRGNILESQPTSMGLSRDGGQPAIDQLASRSTLLDVSNLY